MSAAQPVRLFQPGIVEVPARSDGSDLDTAEQIDRMVKLFYDKVLADELLAPVFLDVAKIDLAEHLPLIASFWRKLLLGDRSYNRNMVARHRAVDDKERLTGAHHERWLGLFHANLDEHFEGPLTDRARALSSRIMNNLYEQLSHRHG